VVLRANQNLFKFILLPILGEFYSIVQTSIQELMEAQKYDLVIDTPL